MKRILCVLLAVLCLQSLCAFGGNSVASAEEVSEEAEQASMPPYEPLETKFGFRFEYPEEYQNLKGELAWWITSYNSTFGDATLFYVEVPEEEREAFREEAALAAKKTDGYMPEWAGQYKNTQLFSVKALFNDDDYLEYFENLTPAGYLNDFFSEELEGGGRTSVPVYQETVSLENNWKLVVQRNEPYTFEAEALPIDAFLGMLGEEYRAEAITLLENPETFTFGLKPEDWTLPGQVGSKISFESQTLQGDPVTSEELFSGCKVTMINVWATWCGPCISELPDLQGLDASFAEKDCQIIGVCLDATRDEAKQEALQLLEKSGVSYPNILVTPDMDWTAVMAIPTSYFVSEDGTILTEPVVGAHISKYKTVLNEALALVG